MYKQENYTEAAAAYILFKDFHPKYKNVAYVIFQIAESFYMQIPDTFDRDLSPAFEAVKYYKELLNFHSNSEYAKGAVEKIKLAAGMIQDKEKYIGDFYFKTGEFSAARYRYLSIIEGFKHAPELVAHSMVRVVESSRHLREKDNCTKYYNMFKDADLGKNSKKLKNAYDKCMKL